LRPGAELTIVREPENPHDPNAIAIYYGHLQIGFLNRKMAAHIAPLIDAGARYRASVASVTGGGERHRGVNVRIERDAVAAIERREKEHIALRHAAEFVQHGDDVRERIRTALIGSSPPHDAQLAVLERIEAGKNTLAVLGTGRGKSFCFQLTAAVRAFTERGKTLVVYPLRALANDQYEAMVRRLDPLGLRIYRANGSIGGEERSELFEALREGAWDVVLATPEFLDFHRDAFAGASRPSFVVVDEAHHVHESRHRPAYERIASTIAQLGSPQVLALTATAGDDAFERIVGELGVAAWVIDPTVRENLHVVDARGRKDKLEYLAQLFSAPEKGIVYCNSRSESVKIAQSLRKRLGNEVMFYHAKMPTAERHLVERYFRDGGLRVVVATSAFGEGIDLPDVRHVVLYHLNFDFAEFNQQAGRAGRDGGCAQIHLLYGENDRRLNEYLIDLDAPRLPVLREIYRGMKSMASRTGCVRSGCAEIAGVLALDGVRDRTVAAAVQMFADAGLVEIGEDDDGRFLRFLPASGKVDLEKSERYAEGEAIRESFGRFSRLALEASAQTLERVVNRPIYPGHVDLCR
jgi:single-stranded-DNA-specific exonuclease